MLESIVIFAAPVLLILIGAAAALALSSDRAEERGATIAPEATVGATIAAELPAAELFRPGALVAEAAEFTEEIDYGALIASIEAHLSTEHKAATAFVQTPSAETLWVN